MEKLTAQKIINAVQPCAGERAPNVKEVDAENYVEKEKPNAEGGRKGSSKHG